MSHRSTTIAGAALLALSTLPAAEMPKVEIPHQKFVLPNGLTLIVHEDRKAPIVAVNIWYHVGSKNEKQGKTGFAHLFEHLMFNGSENFNDDYFQVLERIGGTDLNGTTNEDRTNYFQNVPTSALDSVLFLESDRMGHLLGAVDQARLDEQRGVVQNEKRQYENQPYGLAEELITTASFPKGHPYSWTVIGSMEDLDAASLGDVQEWFKAYYGAANAVLVIAGDIDAQTAKSKVEKYFGDIPSGPPVTRHQTWIAKRSGTQRQVAQDRVPQSRIYKVWNMPPDGDPDADYLNLVSDILAQGKTSRLFKRLVYTDQTATDAVAYVEPREIAGLFTMRATARPGVELSVVEKALDEELDRFLREGPTDQEMSRIKTEYFANFVRGAERIGGFGGKSDILARGEVFHGRPDAYKETLARVEKATAKDLQEAARRWLSDGVYALEIHPFPSFSTISSNVDRSKLPEPGTPPEGKLPAIQRASLPNGLQIVLAERHETPLVSLQLLADSGYAADQFARPGTARLAMEMLDEGTKSRTSLEISEELAQLGATLSASANLDASTVSLSTLKTTLPQALDIFADVILNPSFPAEEFQRLKQQQLAGIEREKVQPVSMALRVFPTRLYGKDHAYGAPLTGSGTRESVEAITLEDLKKYHQQWFKPNNATVIVVGDTTLAEMRGLLEQKLGSWQRGETPKKNISEVSHQPKASIYLVDKPGSVQSVIIAGHIAPPQNNPREIALETMNTALGGMFTSRINMNLREEKHWSYGAQSLFWSAKGQRPFLAFASVQTDKTAESMVEILKELKDVVGARPLTEDELLKAQQKLTLTLPGRWETIRAVAGSLGEIVRYGLPEDYFDTYPAKVRALTTGDLTDAAKSVLRPDRLVWVVVGDREKVIEGIRKLGIADVELIDADGNSAS